MEYGLLSVSSVFKPLLSETVTTEEVLISTVPQKVVWEQSHDLHAEDTCFEEGVGGFTFRAS